MISPKAVLLGALTVVIVGLVFSAVSPPFEMFFAHLLIEDGDSLNTVIDKMYWPATVFIWVGIFAAFGLGSFVAERFSRSGHALDAAVVLTCLLIVVWAIRLYSGVENLLGVAQYSIVAILATVVGVKLARRRQITSESLK